VIKAPSAEGAVAIANDVRFGLVASIFTRDLRGGAHVDEPGRGRGDQGERPDLRRGLPRTLRRVEGIEHRAAGAGLAARDFYTESRTLLIVP
jgi:hypothetical protein